MKLARDPAVALESRAGSEVVLRVPSPGRVVPPTVVLYPDESEWTCDCGSRNDPCEHCVAAAILLNQGQLADSPLRSKSSELRYELSIVRQRLRVERSFEVPGEQPQRVDSLASLVARGACPFAPSEDDLAIDRLLNAVPRGDFNLTQLTRLLGALSTCKVSFAGAPVRTSSEPLKPVGRVFDRGSSVVLEVTVNPELSEVLAPGLARANDELRPLGAVQVSGYRMEKLPLVRSLTPDRTAELVDRILPELSKFIEVDVQSRRLPTRAANLKPWLQFDLSHQGHTLSILPTLVYGRPPVARLDADKLTLFGQTAPRRMVALEQELLEALKDQLNLMPGRRVHFDGEEAARFVDRLRRFQAGQDANSSTPLVDLPDLVARVSLDAAHFDVQFETETDGHVPASASAAAVLKAWRDGNQSVPLAAGGFANIPTDWLDRFGEHVATLLAARDHGTALPTFLVPTLAKLCSELGQPPPAEFKRLAPLFEDFVALPPATLPADLGATLRPYQLEAVRWLGFLKRAGLGAVLADDMGLGKTLQTLATISGKTLVVCPRSVLFNWEREAERFRPALKVCVFHGPNRTLDPSADLVLTTYALLRLDLEVLSACSWDMAVLDEAQTIKNPDSQAAQAAFQLEANFKVALSGTPVENRLEELWSIFRFTHPGLLGSRSSFTERFEKPIALGSAQASGRLRELTKPFLLRRLKSVVAKDLPPRSDALLPIELEPSERAVYDAVLAATKKEVVQELKQGGSVMRALEALLRLRQAACHPALIPGQQAESSSKVEALLDALGDVTADGHKALVFSQWTSFLDLMEPHLAQAEIPFARLDGKTRNRGEVVENFQRDDGPPVLLASLKAGGTGLNLTAADHVFLMDPWYNPAAEDQAADRAHRIGQDRPVMVYRLVARRTVEEGIALLQEKKRKLALNALSGAAAATAITREDLLRLLD